MRGLSMKIIVFLFLLALAGCTNSGDTTNNTNSGDTINNTDQLKQDILSSACDEELRKYLTDRINKLEKTLTEKQLIKNLNDIKSDIKCD